jgi:cell division protein FtsW
MKYFYEIFQNLKSNLPLFTIIGIFAAILIGFKEFQEDKLPIFLKHNLLLIYLFILFGTAQLLVIACVLKPLVSSKIANLILQQIFTTSKVSAKNSLQIIIVTFLLVSVGTLMIYSSSRLEASLKFGSLSFFLNRHLFFIFMGLIFCLFSSFVKYSFLKRIAIPIVIFSIFLLVFGLIPGFGTSIGGSRRWITIGILSFNYFELIKVTIIIYLAYMLSSNQRINIISVIPIGVIFLLIIFLGKNTGYSAGIISLLIITMILMIIARLNYRKATICLLFIEFVYLLFLSVPLYTQSQKLGGILGVGFGEGKYKLHLQFEAFTNFIFLIFTEELGLIGSLIIICLFLLLTLQGVSVARKSDDIFVRLLTFGAVGIISLQAFQNIAISLKVLPFEEISLPFISYGGTQMLINLCLVGLILNASRRISVNARMKDLQ